ncbi:MobF family relaxase [Hansschlegelia sp. KR7-227]|uniref:MobF family relaxase n=1 Tax=Hansschlegelia sp. KR7-227 TaxID=3400914 RepID=UPI003C0DD6E2
MVTRPNKVFSAAYFSREVEGARYYLAAKNLGAIWLKGDHRLDVAAGAAVEAKDLERLFEARDADGSSLLHNSGGVAKRVAALELSVGVSKSVSAAWALGDERQRAEIETAFHKSLEAVADHVERNTFARLGRGGATLVAVRPTLAAFIQVDTRPVQLPDGTFGVQPQLHAHLVIPNCVTCPDGKVRSVDGAPIYRGAKSWGAVQHAVFAAELQKLGYAIEAAGENGTFEIVPPDAEREADRALRTVWSQRRAAIVAKLGEAGLTTAAAPALAAKAAVATRRGKVAEAADVFERWRAEAAAQGVDVPNYVARRQTSAELRLDQQNVLIAKRMASVPGRLTDREATFSHHDLVREVASALVGTGAGANRIDAEIETLEASGAIVALGETTREKIFTTPQMQRLEREALAIASRLSGARFRTVDKNRLDERCREAGLSAEQTEAARAITAGRRLAFLEGRAGTGKTTLLRPVCQAFAPNVRVIGAATAWRTAKLLTDELGIEAKAIDKWLADARAGKRFVDRSTVLLVDETSQVGVKAMHALLAEVERGGGAVVFLGDRAQTLPVPAGFGLDLVARTTSSAQVTQVVRQTAPRLRALVEGLARGEVRPALETFAAAGAIHETAGHRAAVREAVDRWMGSEGAPSPGDALLIARTNAGRLALDAEVRGRLRQLETLRGPDVAIDAVTASGKPYELKLAVGDRIRFGVRADIGDGVINGTTGEVLTVAPAGDGHADVTALVDGKAVAFFTRELADETGRARLATDYATTVFSAQGLTSDKAVILADAGYDRRGIYVAVSRARKAVELVVDRDPLTLACRAESGFELAAADIGAGERLEYLAAQLSRRHVKTSTLDLLPHDAGRLAQLRRDLVRDRGSAHEL